MRGDHEEELAFVKNIAVDQHALAQNRQYNMFKILAVYPELLGISIDENTDLLISAEAFEAIG